LIGLQAQGTGVPRDTEAQAGNGVEMAGTNRAPQPGAPTETVAARPRIGLPIRLLFLTVLFVMLAEVLIFVPSIANFRVSWLTDRLTAARLAALAADAVPGGVVPEAVRGELLSTAQVRSVAIKSDQMRRLVLPANGPFAVDAKYDLREMPEPSPLEQIRRRFQLIIDALAVFFTREDRTVLVYGHPAAGPGSSLTVTDFVEIVLAEAPLKAAMLRYGLNVLALSVIISMIAAALVYLALSTLLVRPMMRITRNMLHFSQNPEDTSRIIVPSSRTDEIGIAERELAHMQSELSQMLHQKNRLAQLGLAVSKINHDLRNMLASAQLISDRLGALQDPTVQQFAPKLIASLDRAINFCNDILRFGRAAEAAPRRELMLLRKQVEEVGEGLGLPRDGIAWRLEIDPTLRIDADPEHLFRILNNLCRNAAQAMAGQRPGASGEILIKAWREGRCVFAEVRDTGPGVPEKAQAHLFQAFQGSARKGGTGLGLAIAAELAAAHGGALRLLETEKGAAFRLQIPDRRTAMQE
jgi:signal transduction histidine kinase